MWHLTCAPCNKEIENRRPAVPCRMRRSGFLEAQSSISYRAAGATRDRSSRLIVIGVITGESRTDRRTGGRSGMVALCHIYCPRESQLGRVGNTLPRRIVSPTFFSSGAKDRIHCQPALILSFPCNLGQNFFDACIRSGEWTNGIKVLKAVGSG